MLSHHTKTCSHIRGELMTLSNIYEGSFIQAHEITKKKTNKQANQNKNNLQKINTGERI